MNDVAPKDRDISMVFQNYALYPHMTVRENIAFPLKLRKMDKAAIDQRVYFVEKPEKKKLLVSLLREEDKSVLVFSRTKHGADNISRLLSKSGIRSEAIHGNKSQNHRQRVLTDFKSGKIRVMVATDIAARGIDIRELEIVINYDLPDVPETYVHRIGRTGRAGHSGTALTFCTPDERPLMKDIQRLTGKKLNAETYRA